MPCLQKMFMLEGIIMFIINYTQQRELATDLQTIFSFIDIFFVYQVKSAIQTLELVHAPFTKRVFYREVDGAWGSFVQSAGNCFKIPVE